MAVKNYLEKGGDPNKVALLTMNINKVEQLSNADITINHGQAQLGEGEAKQERASQSPEGDQA
jgi:predicted Zn-dependent protease